MPLLPYAVVKPHAPDACPQRHGPIALCHPSGPGHHVCQNPACPGVAENNGAGRAATLHTLRHATAAEYAAIPPGLMPIDGVAHQAVFMCDECAEDTNAHDRFCAHADPVLPPCPKCSAKADQPCLRKDGATPLGFNHGDRPPLVYDVCRHAHREDCGIFAGCACTGDDPNPVRPKRTVVAGPEPDASRLLIPPIAAQVLLAEHGIPWAQVREVASVWTQDTKPAIKATIARLDDTGQQAFDDHGQPVLDEVVIPVEKPAT